MGTNVDVYQRAEGRYRLMPEIIAGLRDSRNPFSILTKGTLILRDLDLLTAGRRGDRVGLSVSVGFVDEDLWRIGGAGHARPQRRLDVCASSPTPGFRRRADGPGAAVPVRLAQPSSTPPSRADRRGRRHPRQPDRAAPAAGRPRVVPGLAGRASPVPGPPLPRAVRGRAYAPRDYQERITEQVRELAQRYRVGRRRPAPARPAGRGPGPAAAQPETLAEEQLTLL